MSSLRYQVLALDFDGVIVDSNDIKTKAIFTLFSAEAPRHVDAAVAFHKKHLGLNRLRKFELIFRDIIGQALPEKEAKRLADEFGNLVKNRVAECELMPGAEDVLKQFSGRIPIYIVSATPEEELLEILRRQSLLSYFKGIFGSPTTKGDALRKICRAHGLSPEELLFVGDSTLDFYAAQAASTDFIGIASASEPQSFPPDVKCIHGLGELQKWLVPIPAAEHDAQ